MDNLLIYISLLFLTLSTISLLFIKDSFSIVLTTSLISLFSAISYTTLDAIDVAFTEVAVGAGISTTLFLITLHLTKSYSLYKIDNSRYKAKKHKYYIALSILFFLIMLESLGYIPIFGSINNPAHNDIYNVYVKTSYNTFYVPNMVTMVLGSFRGFDTLGETSVVLIAGLGVYLILQGTYLNKNTLNNNGSITYEENGEYLLTSASFALTPILLLYASYVQFHGDLGPGGGFQAGIIVACAYILVLIVYGKEITSKFISIASLLKFLALGVAIYALTGLYSLLMGGKFMDYYYFGKDFAHSYHYGLLLIELGVAITVFASMSTILGQFFKKLGSSND